MVTTCLSTPWRATGGALERMETNISAVLQNDTACISALHVLKVCSLLVMFSTPLTPFQTVPEWIIRLPRVCVV